MALNPSVLVHSRTGRPLPITSDWRDFGWIPGKSSMIPTVATYGLFSLPTGDFSSQEERFFLDAKGEKEYVSWVQLGSPRFQDGLGSVQASAADW